MIYNIQILRFVASFFVLFFHANAVFDLYSINPGIFKLFFNHGSYGVDIFFVISGFIIYKTVNINTQYFTLKRLFRIFPIYLIITSLFSILILLFPDHINSQFSFSHYIASLLFLSQTLGFGDPVLGVGWSLEYEMLFYFIFGLIIFLKSSRYLPYVFILFCILSIINANNLIFFEFYVGCFISHLYINTKIFKTNNYLGLFFILLSLIFMFCLLNQGYSFNKINFENRFFTYGVFAILFFIGIIYLENIKSSFFLLLGASSYSLYLIHHPVLSLLGKIYKSYFIFIPGSIYFILCIFIVLFVSVMFYVVIERNIIEFLKKKYCATK